jgi:methylsterol monooxygenase
LFIIISVLTIIAAVKNTLTWLLQSFWGDSSNFWQAQWDRLLDVIGDDPYTLSVYVPAIYTFAVYWIIGGIYTIMDITNKPAALRRYKIQAGTNEPVETKRLMTVIGWVLFNQTVVTIPLAHSSYQLMLWRGHTPIRVLPTFHWVLVDLAVNIIMVEIGFYYGHRLLHSSYLYRFIHKRHHEWTAPIAVTAAYCHPIEHVISNVMPLFLGPLIMGSHVATILLWLTLAIMITLNDHSGYHLPFFPSPEPHDFHHLKFNQCYGVIGVLDRIHGTDVMFRKSKSYARHILMLNLKSPREAFPDDSKCKTK